MKTGYPFLAISKKHNVEYGIVLKAAELFYKAVVPTFIQSGSALEADILSACAQHRDLQNGTRDFSEQYQIAA